MADIVVEVMTKEWTLVAAVVVGVECDIDVATSAGCTMGGECRSSGAGEEDVDEPEEIKIGSWMLLTVVGCGTAGWSPAAPAI